LTNYNLSDLYLKGAAWFVGHKDFFKKWWVIALLSLDLIMVVYGTVMFVKYSFETPRYNTLISQMGRDFISAAYRQQRQPQALQIIYARAIARSADHYDLVAKVKNPNTVWGLASLGYQFKMDGQATGENTGYLLPQEEKYFILLNQAGSATAPQTVEFVPVTYDWQKLSDLTLLDKVKFTVTDAKLTQSQTASGGVSSTVTATVKNDSLYGFWSVEVPVIVEVNGLPLAVSQYTLRQFKSSDKKEISASWLANLPLTATVIVQPATNLLDASNLMSL